MLKSTSSQKNNADIPAPFEQDNSRFDWMASQCSFINNDNSSAGSPHTSESYLTQQMSCSSLTCYSGTFFQSNDSFCAPPLESSIQNSPTSPNKKIIKVKIEHSDSKKSTTHYQKKRARPAQQLREANQRAKILYTKMAQLEKDFDSVEHIEFCSALIEHKINILKSLLTLPNPEERRPIALSCPNSNDYIRALKQVDMRDSALQKYEHLPSGSRSPQS